MAVVLVASGLALRQVTLSGDDTAHDTDAASGPQLLEKSLQVRMYGMDGQAERLGDLALRQIVEDELGDLQLAVTQPQCVCYLLPGCL